MNKTEKLALEQTQDMEKQLYKHMRALTWSAEKLKNERQSRLQKILAHAKQHSPWYRKKLAKINIEKITEDNISDLPTLDKGTLMDNWDEIITVPNITLSQVEDHIEKMLEDQDALYFLDRYHVMVTGGSSGHRGVFIYNWDEWNDYYLMFRRYRLYKSNPDILLNPNKKVILALVSSANTIHGIYSLAKTYKSRYTQFFHFPLSLPTFDIVKGLNELQPDVLQGSPFSIYRLSKEVTDGHLLISPKSINVFAEPCHPDIRHAIEKAWPSSKIFNTYGTSEGLSALNCTEHRKEMHLNDDMCIVEPVDTSGNKINKGILSSKIYMTNLFNFTLPLIRYQIDDELLFLEKSCDCGIQYQLIEEPQGKPDFDFTYPNNVFIRNIVFTAALLQDRNIQEYQIIQTISGVDVKFLSKGPINEERLRKNLTSKLCGLGLHQPIINFINVPKFDYPPSGKLKRFIPLNLGLST